MNTNDYQQKIVQYGVSLSLINFENIDTGLLSMERFNLLKDEQVLALSQETEGIIKEFVNAYEQYTDLEFERYESGILFQYVFDKVVEVTYKTIMGLDVDTQFALNEPFEYHEPDLPEYIQLKLTNNVDKISLLCCKIIDFIDDNSYRTERISDWLFPLLLVVAYVGIEYAQEIDLTDDTEMRHYLNED